MSILNLLALPIIFWVLPVWCIAALYCESIAARKNHSAGEWFFRGMGLNIMALTQILAEPVQESAPGFKPPEDGSLNSEATKTLLSVLLILLGIPFYSILFATVFSVFIKFLEGRAFPIYFESYWLFEYLMWFPLVWLVSVLGSVPLARYKGSEGKTWALLAGLGAELSAWMLLKSKPAYESPAKAEHFLEDELTSKLVDRIMAALAVPCRIMITVGLIGLLGFLIGRVFSPAARAIAICPRDLFIASLVFVVCFTGWLLPAACSWMLSAIRGFDRVKWTLLGFFATGFAPLILCSQKSSLPDTAPTVFSADERIDEILRWLVFYAQLPWTALICLAFVLPCFNDAHLSWNQPVVALVPFLVLCLGQFIFCPFLLALFLLAKGRRPMREVLTTGCPRAILALAIAHLLSITLLLIYSVFAIIHLAGAV